MPGTERDTISIDIEVPIAVHHLDPLALIEQYREDWDRLDEESLRHDGYEPWERFPVFVSNVLAHNLDVTTGLERAAEHTDDGWVDVRDHWRWTHEDAQRLAFLLDEQSTASMDRAPNVPSLFDDDE